MKKMYNTIVYITDKKFINISAISLFSLKYNKKSDVKYKIYVLFIECANDYIIRNLDSEDFKIIPIFIKNNCFKRNDNIGVVYYKLLLPNLLNEENKIFLIDSDTLIIDDISDVFNFNPQYITAAYNANGFNRTYCNAGIMLMNLNNIRKLDNFLSDCFDIEKKLESIQERYWWEQDILNTYFKGKMDILPYQYNFLLNLYSTLNFNLWEGYVDKCPKNIKILHYAGDELKDNIKKPWTATMKDLTYNNPALRLWRIYRDAFENNKKINKIKENLIKQRISEATWGNQKIYD